MKRAPHISILGTLIVCLTAGGCFEGEDEQVVAGVPVERGAMQISVVQRGNLEAKDAISIKSEIERQVTIIHLIPEGDRVEPGDLLVELDVSDLVDRKVTQEISVQNADANFTKAKQNFAIQRSENESLIDAAEDSVLFSEMDLNKYIEGDWPQQLQVGEESIILAQEEKKRSEERLNWSRNLADKGFLTRTELEGDELASKRAEILLEQAKREKELLIAHQFPRQKKQLEADLEEARRELERSKLRAQARLVDFEAAMNTGEKKLDLEREKLAKIVDQIEKGRIVSPVAGMVIYTREEGRRWGGGEPMQVGSQVREREEILNIPRDDGMVAEASVHESVLNQVVPGVSCTVKVNALRDATFEGRVEFVAPLPDQASWWANPDQRLFKTEVSIAEPHPDMRPGMSCSVEFQIETIEDTLFIPLQSVLVHEGRTICFIDGESGAEQRAIEVGKSNDKYAEIISGAREGEIVLLSPPPGFSPKGAPEGERRPSRPSPAEGGPKRPSGEQHAGPTGKAPKGVGGTVGTTRGDGASKGPGASH